MDPSAFATRQWPLRPSRLGKFLKCPMGVVISMLEEDKGAGPAAQTGSLVHLGVQAFHQGKDGVSAIHAGHPIFPKGNLDKALAWYAAYVADPKNQSADVRWLEKSVTLDYKGVYIEGTLDQVRYENGVLSVWDVKTGDSLDSYETVDEYQAQQAGYVLAARQSLDSTIVPGGIINLAGYDQPRGRRFLPMGVTVEDCEQLMDVVVERVNAIRAGARQFTPSASACLYCPHKRFPKCKAKARGVLGHE